MAARRAIVLHPAVRALRDLVETDPVLRMYANRMIEEEPKAKEYADRPLDSSTRCSGHQRGADPGAGIRREMVATPLGAILDWTRGRPVSRSSATRG